MKISSVFRGLIIATAAVSLAGCGINSVPTAEENAKAKWADVENQYQRRADLIPNLVSTVNAASDSEKDIIVGVSEARAKAMGVTLTTDDLSNPAEFQKYQAAQNQLTQALGQFRSVVENYPDLKSNENFLTLQSQLEGTENRISTARRDYNEAVREYNTTIRTFPDSIGASIIHGAKPMEPFSAVTEGANEAPKVDFGN